MNITLKRVAWRASLLLPTILLGSAALAGSVVRWPQGWEQRSALTPTSKAGEHFDGSNQLALKIDQNGQIKAALNLTVLKIKTGDIPNLDGQTASMIATIRDGYTAKGLEASCDAPQKTMLGDVQARQTRCRVRKDKAEVLAQEVVVAIGARTVQSLSYTAQLARFQTYEADFIAMRDSLRPD
ncbi:DUF4946 domain-containing protein [Brucella intermedia GD04153]|uniref:DUF4946 domain-containing protein n=1 Tax=Brucella intermedia GD04153 TaxID=2975438 RepID=A0AA42KMJ0_9HYPH|nr:DUF4946 domain-containing protein [Brucella intermedia]MDH0126968.1 DUF4946 domain-containing protein [Brucella intermedia GD04153]